MYPPANKQFPSESTFEVDVPLPKVGYVMVPCEVHPGNLTSKDQGPWNMYLRLHFGVAMLNFGRVTPLSGLPPTTPQLQGSFRRCRNECLAGNQKKTETTSDK